jgi:hypothetical protein
MNQKTGDIGPVLFTGHINKKPADEGKERIRVDGLVRSNAGVAMKDTVTVKKIKAVPAEKVVGTLGWKCQGVRWSFCLV